MPSHNKKLLSAPSITLIDKAVNVPERGWTGASNIHRSVSFSTPIIDPKNRVVNQLALVYYSLNEAHKLTKWSWLVSAQQFFELAMATIELPYTQTQKTATHRHVNKQTDNVYTFVARMGKICLLLRSYSEHLHDGKMQSTVRLRLAIENKRMQEEMLADTDLALDTVSQETATRVSEGLATLRMVAEGLKANPTALDFTPEVRERKRQKVRVTEGEF